MMTTLLVALGGALGSVARYWVGIWCLPISRAVPMGTMLINIVGSFVIAFFGALTLANGRYPMPEAARIFVMVGLCGGFTTFSSFSLQTVDLLRAGAPGRAAVNVVASVVLCVAATAVGYVAASHLNGGLRQVAQTAVEEEAG